MIPSPRRLRLTEALLLALALLVFGLGGAQALLARQPVDATPVDINTASIAQIQRVLPAEAARIVAERTASGPYSDLDALVRQRLVAPGRLRTERDRLAVRPWRQIPLALLMTVGALAVLFLGLHVALRRIAPTADPFLLPIAALLAALGILLLFGLKDPLRDRLAFVPQAHGIGLGAVALLVALSRPFWRLPLRRYGYLYALGASGLTVLVGALGHGPGGVRLSVAGFQPVEVAKILMVFFLASYLAERGATLPDPIRALPRRTDALPLLALYTLPLGLFALLKDLGPALLLLLTFLALVYAATGRRRYGVAGLATLAAGGALGYLSGFGVFRTRVEMWLSPWDNARLGGDQLAHGLWGLASGGALGSGLGRSGAPLIPRAGSDLIFASLGEELGLPGSALVLLCLAVLVVRGFSIARRAASDFDRLLAAGITALLGIQSIVIVAGVLGAMPLTGITLPLLAYGKSSLAATFFAIGLLLAISARCGTEPRPDTVPLAHIARILTVALVALAVRCVWVQAIAADTIAVRICRTPDADRVRRPHTNPRLLLLADRIPRGRLVTTDGTVLAQTDARGRRVYPLGDDTAHLVGYLDPSLGGPTGFEETYQWKLRGFDGLRGLVGLWRRKDFPGTTLPEGTDVTVTIDADLQRAARRALTSGAAGVRDRKTGQPGHRGAVVVLDIATGAIRAAVTLPTYDPGTLSEQSFAALRADRNGDHVLVNRALSGRYPPGSTFKVVTAAALLAAGRGDFTTRCTHTAANTVWKDGNQTFARRRLTDDESERAHGTIGLTDAIAQSCNLFFARAGIAVGADMLRDTAAAFGFSRLPARGTVAAELPEIADGQGSLLITPLEMASVAATIASEGRRHTPHFLADASPESAVAIPAADAGRIADGMRRVTLSGTAAGRFSGLPFSVAGKTGTAQTTSGDGRSHSWFIGFAPADRPQVAIAVLVENGGYGARTAVPIARDILRAAVR